MENGYEFSAESGVRKKIKMKTTVESEYVGNNMNCYLVYLREKTD